MAVTGRQFEVSTDGHEDAWRYVFPVQLYVVHNGRRVTRPTAEQPCYSLLKNVYFHSIVVQLFFGSELHWYRCLRPSTFGGLNHD